eukprot:6191013-Pleurochrysis_carterae.AAC.6
MRAPLREAARSCHTTSGACPSHAKAPRGLPSPAHVAALLALRTLPNKRMKPAPPPPPPPLRGPKSRAPPAHCTFQLPRLHFQQTAQASHVFDPHSARNWQAPR